MEKTMPQGAGPTQHLEEVALAGLAGTPRQGLIIGTWGFFIGFAAVALYGPAAQSSRVRCSWVALAVGLLVAAPQLTGSLAAHPVRRLGRPGRRAPADADAVRRFASSACGAWCSSWSR